MFLKNECAAQQQSSSHGSEALGKVVAIVTILMVVILKANEISMCGGPGGIIIMWLK